MYAVFFGWQNVTNKIQPMIYVFMFCYNFQRTWCSSSCLQWPSPPSWWRQMCPVKRWCWIYFEKSNQCIAQYFVSSSNVWMVNHIRFIDARDKEAPTLSTTTSYVFFKAQHWLIVRSSRISHSWGNVSLQTAVYLKANNPFFTTWKSKSTSACSATLAKLLIDQKLVFVLLRILIGPHFCKKKRGNGLIG